MTILPMVGNRVRIGFNRDEQRSRPTALPPTIQSIGRRRVLMPIDPISGGTWLAANDAGLVLAVLNVNPPDRSSLATPRASRGTIIPALLEMESPGDAIHRIETTMNLSDFAPFRLVLVGGGLAADAAWNGRDSMIRTRLLGGGPLMFTSSGLGDHQVESVRRELFDQSMPFTPEAQDAFHRHEWSDRRHLSVNMSRADARTVSHSVVELNEPAVRMRYWPNWPSEQSQELALPTATVEA